MMVSRDQLERMYVKKDMTIVTIAYCLGIHSKTVSDLLSSYGIPKKKHGSIDYVWRRQAWSK